MRNIFDFATKELSQDAFLMWLIGSYEGTDGEKCKNEEVRKVAWALLNAFLGTGDSSSVTVVDVKAQFKKIDVFVECLINGRPHFVAIEDKTTSFERSDQLNRYMGKLGGLGISGAVKISFIFFKTDLIGDDDLKKINKAGWKPFGIEEIYDVFAQLINTGSEILDDYADFIRRTFDYNCVPFKDWNLRNWGLFLEREVHTKYPKNSQNFNNLEYDTGRYLNMYQWVSFERPFCGANVFLEINIRLPYLISSCVIKKSLTKNQIDPSITNPHEIDEKIIDRINGSAWFSARRQGRTFGILKKDKKKELLTKEDFLAALDSYLGEFNRIFS
jgi:hypothetical protein